MPLERYNEKRDFSKTPEPAGVEGEDGAVRRFVIQKHAATRLHYDFRLEMDGVFRSWAVPKGPSYDTSQKRLAVEVEDHPLDYGDFEGTIPQGEYGGGTVMVWDRGTWEPHGDAEQMYRDGSMKFGLHGSKLEGSWALVRMKRKEGERNDNWLLIKERDGHAVPLSEGDVLKDMPVSAKTGRTMEEIAAQSSSDDPVEGDDADPSVVSGAIQAPLPERLEPQLATAVDRAPDGDEWLHEIKLDGYRALCRVSGGEAHFYTRSGADWTDRFAALVPDASALPVQDAWLDGEVVVVRPDGTTSFGALQAELGTGRSADIVYFAFDVLYLDGYDVRRVPLTGRKQLLRGVLGAAKGRVRYLDHVVGRGPLFHLKTCSLALEGSVSKRADGAYKTGRGRDWRKRKCLGREEFAVIGYTDSTAHRAIGALALGARGSGGALAYAGRVGTGFSDREADELKALLEPLAAKTSAVDIPAAEARGVHPVKPDIVVEVEFSEWTESGVLRHPSFVGIRGDKTGAEVSTDPPAKTGPATVAGVRLTHPQKVLFDAAGFTKLQLATYYEQVASWILPHLRERPVVLVRCPHGSTGECFYQKDASTGFPDSIRTVQVQHDEGPVHYALVDEVSDLVSLAQLGVLEIHTWGSLADDVERPDRIIFDLDPGPDVEWKAVVSGALMLRERLESLGLGVFVKTTGGKGLHLVSPIVRDVDWGEARAVTKTIADAVAAEYPALYTTNPLKARREGRIFIDYIRNTRGATAVAAYSTRARDGAPVSVPVRWDEIEAGVRSDGYDIASTPRRLRALGTDPWDGYESSRAPLGRKVRNALGML
ncbi:MAG: DNA ligase D [Coriobacteriia bacterium]|nr:DNA ligase D [Coriobacteriia bacterium]